MALPADGAMTLSDTVTIGNAISALISPAFKAGTFGLGLVHSETCSSDSNVIKFRKSGSLVAEAVTENAAYTPSDANSDINDTSVTATAVKVMVASPITAEAMRFGAGAASATRIAAEQGRAIARKFDVDLCALFNGITNTSIAASTMDADTLLGGQFKIYSSNCPPGPTVAVLSHKQVFELKKVVTNAGAAVWSNALNIPLIGSVPAANGFVGNFLGTDVYQTDVASFTTSGGDDQGAMWNPLYGFAAALGGAVETALEFNGKGIANQNGAITWDVISWIFYHVVMYNDGACCEIRSDT